MAAGAVEAIGGALALIVVLGIVYWCCSGGWSRILRRTVDAEVSDAKVSKYMQLHKEDLWERLAERMEADLEVGCFDSDGDDIAEVDDPFTEKAAENVDLVVREDEKGEGLITAYMHFRKSRKQPLTVQTSRPLAQPIPELHRDVYYEVVINELDEDSKLIVGWATSPFPPFVAVGDERAGHSIGLLSAGTNTVHNTRDMRTGKVAGLGTSGKLVLTTSGDDRCGVALEDTEIFRAGDTIGCGYRQTVKDSGTREGMKLTIEFFWRVNNHDIVIPAKYTQYFCINKAWDPENTELLMQTSRRFNVGVLANVRLEAPFKFHNGVLSEYQNNYVDPGAVASKGVVVREGAQRQFEEILKKNAPLVAKTSSTMGSKRTLSKGASTRMGASKRGFSGGVQLSPALGTSTRALLPPNRHILTAAQARGIGAPVKRAGSLRQLHVDGASSQPASSRGTPSPHTPGAGAGAAASTVKYSASAPAASLADGADSGFLGSSPGGRRSRFQGRSRRSDPRGLRGTRATFNVGSAGADSVEHTAVYIKPGKT